MSIKYTKEGIANAVAAHCKCRVLVHFVHTKILPCP